MNAGDQTLHPYYDAHLLQNNWLQATLDHASPLVVLFSVSPPGHWPLTDKNRVERHFKVCDLATTFTANANDELGPLKARLSQLEVRGGATAVQAYLAEEMQSHFQRPNSWQLAMYRALASNPWFISGGFHSIP